MPRPLEDDYYALLGVHAGADAEDLRRAWRERAARLHPDRAGDGATAAFQRLSAAYAVLADPVARAAYDWRRRGRAVQPDASSAARPAAAATAANPPPAGARRPTPAVMLSRLCRPIWLLTPSGAVRFDEPGFMTLVLSEDEAAQGGMIAMPMRVDVGCPDCATPRLESCSRCGGSGKVEALFTAWLAVPPGVTAGEVLTPSAELPDAVEPVRFRVRLFRRA